MKINRITGVLCCGNVVFDIPVWPVEEFVWNRSHWVEAITESIGGNGANSCYTLGMLGVPVRLISMVGGDARGDRLIQILDEAGVDTSFITRSPEEPTPTTVAVVNRAGERMFLHRPGASRDVEAEAVFFNHGATYSHFHLANPFALPKLRAKTGDVIARAKTAGLTVSMDTGWDSKGLWMREIGPALPNTDLLFVNEAEAQMLGGDKNLDRAVANLRSQGATGIVVKLGERGCAIFADAERVDVPGFAVRTIDTTGAGDCFVGAFLAGIHLGLPYTGSARLANAAGAMNVENLGASAGVRTLEETRAWMESHTK